MDSPLPQIFDTIIIGAGPAGLSAAVYAVRKNLKVLLLSKNLGGQAALSADIENYLGFTSINGVELTRKFREDIDKFKNQGIWIKEGLEVISLSGKEPDFVVTASDGQNFHGKTVIIASGRVPRMLGIPGEREYLGKGVATCATCDAPLFAGKDVAVVGGGNSALDAAFALSKASKSVTIININEDVKGDDILVRNIKTAPNVRILNNHDTLQVFGEQFVTGVKIRDKTSGQEQILPVSGIFIEIGWIPSSTFDNLTHKNQKGEIMVDEYGQTSVDGIWAAGDVNDLWGEQIIIAAGEGAKVALSVAEHIAKIPHQATSNVHEGS